MAIIRRSFTSFAHPTVRTDEPFRAHLRHDINFAAREYRDRIGGINTNAATGTVRRGPEYAVFDGITHTMLFSSDVGFRNIPAASMPMNIPQRQFSVEVQLERFAPQVGLTGIVNGGQVVPGAFSWGILQSNGNIQAILSPDGTALDIAASAIPVTRGRVIVTLIVAPTALALYLDGQPVGSGVRTAPTVKVTKQFSIASIFGVAPTALLIRRIRMWDVAIDPSDPRLYTEVIG